jgi:hypothetical protein
LVLELRRVCNSTLDNLDIIMEKKDGLRTEQ